MGLGRRRLAHIRGLAVNKDGNEAGRAFCPESRVPSYSGRLGVLENAEFPGPHVPVVRSGSRRAKGFDTQVEETRYPRHEPLSPAFAKMLQDRGRE